MKREIKFRALENGKIFSWKEMIDRSQGAGSEGISIDYPMYMLNDDSIIWMQYTGLKDKNGKEIYEGDIIQHGEGVFKVFYNSSMASFDIEYPGGECDQLVPSYGEWYADQHEIIGNIYENKNLFDL